MPPPNASRSEWTEVPILKKTIELYKTYYNFLELFPKKDKHTLGAKCEQYIIAVLELLLETSYLPKEAKRPILLKANNKFETLKIFIRVLRELNILDQKKYLTLQSLIQEIGKMFGGWMRSLS